MFLSNFTLNGTMSRYLRHGVSAGNKSKGSKDISYIANIEQHF